MRNLHCCQDRRQQLPLPVELGDVTHFACDSDGGVLFVAGSGLGVAAYRTADCEVGSERVLVWMLVNSPRSRGADTSAAGAAPTLPPPPCCCRSTPAPLPSLHHIALHADVVVC